MLSFALPSGATLLQQAEAWRKDSRTHFNRELDLGGWLLSPMRWGSRQVVIMLRVFHQLDMAVEEAWVLKAVERRQVELNALGLQQWKDREAMASHDVVTADVKPTKLDIKVLNSMRGAARYHEEQRKHRLSCGRPDAYWREVRDRIREWGQGGIRCQLCRANRWSEQCYRHSASACSAWKESESYRMLVDKLSGLEGMGRGDGAGDGTCQRCMFPVQVCQLAAPEPSSIDSTADEWGACRGTEVMKQTVAALLMREGGALGTQVINQEMAEWEQQIGGWDDSLVGWWERKTGFAGLADEWLQMPVPDMERWQPRLVRIFLRLAGGFELSRALDGNPGILN